MNITLSSGLLGSILNKYFGAKIPQAEMLSFSKSQPTPLTSHSTPFQERSPSS